MSLTFADLFCGAGGSSIGLTAAGMTLTVAANHWQRAIDTHAANFPHAEHLCADVSNYDLRRLPASDVLWASPICTELSPAGGRGRARRAVMPGQTDLLQALGYVPQAGLERTRATFWDVIRATEVHRYRAVLVENVPEAAGWELFDHWVQGMLLLGYRVQYVSVSSAHVGGHGNGYAPQWRDRLYLVFTRIGVPLPDVDPRPLAWCPSCAVDVASVQAWKKTGARRIGKYRAQYVYVCPHPGCRSRVVEPYVLPASAAIDWTDPGTRIGDRRTPLADKTMARIRAGLAMFTDRHSLVTVNHDGHDGRPRPVDAAPLPTQTKRIGDGIVCPPLLVPAGGTWNDTASPVGVPMRTRTARDSEALVTTPFYVKQYGGYADPHRMAKSVHGDALGTLTASQGDSLVTPEPFITVLRNHGTATSIGEPLRTVAAGGNHHALVIPYRRGNNPATTATPLPTMATRDSTAPVHRATDVADCWFRMLKPREQLRAQRFPDTYTVHGNKGEQTTQAGNAVSANVAQWLAQATVTALNHTAALT